MKKIIAVIKSICKNDNLKMLFLILANLCLICMILSQIAIIVCFTGVSISFSSFLPVAGFIITIVASFITVAAISLSILFHHNQIKGQNKHLKVILNYVNSHEKINFCKRILMLDKYKDQEFTSIYSFINNKIINQQPSQSAFMNKVGSTPNDNYRTDIDIFSCEICKLFDDMVKRHPDKIHSHDDNSFIRQLLQDYNVLCMDISKLKDRNSGKFFPIGNIEKDILFDFVGKNNERYFYCSPSCLKYINDKIDDIFAAINEEFYQ